MTTDPLRLKIGTGLLLAAIVLAGCGESSETSNDQAQQGESSETVVVTLPPEEQPTESATNASPESPDVKPTATNVQPVVTPSIWSDLCGSSSSPLVLAYTSPEALAWGSEQVVYGTVVEQLPSSWGDPVAQGEGFDQELRPIFTDYVVKVDGIVRGQKLEQIHVRLPGGTIDGCTIESTDTPPFKVGEQVFLYLYDVANLPTLDGKKPVFDVPTFGLTGLSQGYWVVRTDDTVAPVFPQDAERLLPGRVTSTTVEDLTEELEQSLLDGPPPASELSPPLVVPIDDAPVVTATPESVP